MPPPELLSPAGSLTKMRYAFAYGADAVYAGLPRYSLRARNNEFRLEELASGIAEAHAQKKKFYVTANLMAHNRKVDSFMQDMAPVIELKPDALIMADPGLIMLVRERWPEVAIHLSVQANTVNYASVEFWRRVGVSRVILSRELSLDEIAEIRQRCPEMELEVFIHGALCVAYSGRCLLSGYFNRRDANQGTCTNSCRWDYKLHHAGETPESDVYLLEEGQRPGDYMPIEEDEHGTYILNSKDLRAVAHVCRLVEIGVDSLKIEGRTKSAYYVARTAQVYRRAIDRALAGQDFDPALNDELAHLAQRGYTDGFFQRHQPQDYQNYETGQSTCGTRHYVGDLVTWAPERCLVEIEVKNRFGVGDRLEILLPSGNLEITLEALFDDEGTAISVAPGAGWRVWMPWQGEWENGMVTRVVAETPATT